MFTVKKFTLLHKVRLIFIIFSCTVFGLSLAIQPISLALDGKYDEGFYAGNDILYYNPDAKALCTTPDNTPASTISTSGVKYLDQPVGNIPPQGMEVGSTYYGGQYSNGKWSPNNARQGGGGDDNGDSATGPLPGRTVFAELSNPGTTDFSSMGKLPFGTKLQITYKGKSIIAEKGDVGGGKGTSTIKGKPRRIDLWWEAARLLDFQSGFDVVTIRPVDKSTPVTPVNGGQPSSVSSGDSTSQVVGCTCSVNNIAGIGQGPVTRDIQSFVKAYGQMGIAVNKAYGTPYEAVLAQAIIESAYGKSLLSAKYNNFFGIKAGSGWTGDTINLSTQEDVGNIVTINAAFRVYPSPQEGFMGYGDFITKNSRYAPALKFPGDPYKYIQAIKDAGYATDRNYVSTVSKVIDGVAKAAQEQNLPKSADIKVDTNAPKANVSSTQDCLSSTGNSTTSKIVQIAEAEFAKNVKEYDENVLKYTGGAREPWCSSFVSWVYKEAGVQFTEGSPQSWQQKSVSNLQAWFKKNQIYFTVGEKKPQPGDVAFYLSGQGGGTPDAGSTSHNNIVIAVSGDTMTTIGGNESNQVRKQERKIKLGENSLVGFGRLKQNDTQTQL